METKEIIKEIVRLPVEKILEIEKALKKIRKAEMSARLQKAAEEMYEDYLNDKELTAFTVLDSEQFLPTNN